MSIGKQFRVAGTGPSILPEQAGVKPLPGFDLTLFVHCVVVVVLPM